MGRQAGDCNKSVTALARRARLVLGCRVSLEPYLRGGSFPAVQFYRLAIGARFQFRGRIYRKTAMSMTEDEGGLRNIFGGETEVDPVGELLLLAVDEAERCRPPDLPWWSRLSQAPGQRSRHCGMGARRRPLSGL